ncbi:MAG: hypothetical protein EA344_11725 [Alkalicoccus sp.]|nr:MAG: hypothetical protein EA344_11725 [Alkalicoccus sp.]
MLKFGAGRREFHSSPAVKEISSIPLLKSLPLVREGIESALLFYQQSAFLHFTELLTYNQLTFLKLMAHQSRNFSAALLWRNRDLF